MKLPAEFEKLLAKSLPGDEVAPLLDSLDWPAHTSVRINKGKITEIKNDKIAFGVPWCENGFVLMQRPEFTADPALHAGKYYVQEASSMIIGKIAEKLLLDHENPVNVLDLCAAPGGKSTHLASVLRSGDILVANEVIASRTGILNENLIKWGRGNHMITKSDANKIGQVNEIFDFIFADMPCSGEGLFRKDPMSVNHWSESNVQHCSLRQQRISADVWSSLKPGGCMIYSTCTLNRFENENNIDWICENLQAEILDFDFPDHWNLYSDKRGCYRLLPHRSAGEGFFFAILRKNRDADSKKKQKKTISKFRTINITLPINTHSVSVLHDGIIYSVLNENEEQVMNLLNQLSDIYSPGTPVGKWLEKKGGSQFKPEAGLALLCDLKRGSYPEQELEDQIIPYLKREALSNSEKKEGIYLAIWNEIPIGFMNGIRHQWNNLWPMEWRIRNNYSTAETIVNV